MSAELEARIAELTAQLDRLRAEFDGLRTVFGLRHSPLAEDAESVIPMVRGLFIRNPEFQSEISLMVHDSEAYISMRPDGNKSTVFISTEGDEGDIELRSKDGKREVYIHRGPDGVALTLGDKKTPRAAQMWVVDGRGHSAFWSGDEHPNIILSNDPEGAEVAVTHPNAKFSARLRDTENGGSLTLFHPDGTRAFTAANVENHAHVRLSPAGEKHAAAVLCTGAGETAGGSLQVSMPGGVLQASVVASKNGGVVLLGRADGESVACLSGLEGSGALTLGSAEQRSLVELGVGSGSGRLALADTKGEDRITLNADTATPAIRFTDSKGTETIGLRSTDDCSVIQVATPGIEHRVMLTATAEQSAIFFGSDLAEPALFLSARPAYGGSVRIGGPDNTVQALLSAGQTGGILHLNDELGQERIRFCTIADGGSIGIRWAGRVVTTLSATEKGTLLVAHDLEDSDPVAIWPAPDDEETP